MNRPHASLCRITLAAAAALTMTACGKDDDRSVGQKVDSAITQTEQAASHAGTELRQEGSEAKAAMERSADKAAKAMDQAADTVAAKTADLRITAAINTELAKDPTLSALKIDVDTRDGRVRLQGTAPTAAARDRATTLAAGVKGVSHVENELEVRG